MSINPRYAAWVRCGKPDPFPVWICAAMKEAHRSGAECVYAESNKHYSQPTIRITNQEKFTEWCDFFADNYCATQNTMLGCSYQMRETTS